MQFLKIKEMRRFFSDDSAATAIEYALIASGVAGAIIVVVMGMGTSLKGMYQNVSNGFN
jgi:pilus assembly protein Flp/PilA